MVTLSIRSPSSNTDFQVIVNSFLSDKGLPLASVLPASEIERIFRRYDGLFGNTYNGVYGTAIVLWAFLSQVLADGKMRSCSAAVARIADFLIALDETPPSTDTGEYCKARKKLCEKALHDLVVETARKIEYVAPESWLWRGRHAKLVDGFTATMPDTPENQEAFPQPKSQEPGIGFPIMRVCVILSLATACVLDATFGPYSGKETGETALLRKMLDSLARGDVLVADRYYCSFMMIALLMQRGVDACVRMHQRRHVDFRRGDRLGKYDHLIQWQRPAKPEWMDEETYATIPETITLREIRFRVTANGRRTETLTVVTTLIDPSEYTPEDIAELYGFRWNVELDILQIKQTLNLDHMRCKTPAMVAKELWTTLLGYNLIRRVICDAALKHNKLPRCISFTETCATILASWSNLSLGLHGVLAVQILLERIAMLEVPDRPGRIEPRVLKRRRHRYPLMRQPRGKLKSQLKNANRYHTMT
jgi:putative transposase